MALTKAAAAAKAGHNIRCFERACWDAEENITDSEGYDAVNEDRVQQEATWNLECEASSCTCQDEIDAIKARQESRGLEATGRECKCGCGLPVRRDYLPGHDSKHIAWAVSRVIWNEERWEDLIYEFSTPALGQKFTDRLNKARREAK